MQVKEFGKFLEELNSTTKRLEITSILARFIKELDPEETEEGINLSLGYLKAPFNNPKFNIAEKMMVRVLESTFSVTSEEVNALYQKNGDLGDTAFELLKNHKNHQDTLNIKTLHKQLLEVTEIEGSGSQDLKIKKIAEILKNLDHQSAKYVVRIILGSTRLGFTELTVIDALAQFLGDKKISDEIEKKYNMHPDIGLIAKALKKEGIKGINYIEIETGVPIQPQRCQRLASPDEIIEKMECVWAEYKFDGTRVQLHLDRKKELKGKASEQSGLFSFDENKIFAKSFTRNLEESTQQFPDIIEAAYNQLDATSVILDGEAIGYNRETGGFLPFQETMQRKRKHGVADAVKNIPLKYYAFDILYLNGKSLLDKPLSERRALLKKIIKKGETIEPDEYLEANTVEELEGYYESAKAKNLEGLVIKKPESPYQAGARSYNWVKLKTAQEKLLSDTIDAVVLGYYYGKGMRAEFGIGGFLVGVYDEKENLFKTITKIGTGLKEHDFIHLKELCDKNLSKEKPANVVVSKMLNPDVWTNPKIVVEMGGDEITPSPSHTAGYAVRFPRLIKFREDKNAKDATTLKEILDMHKLQKRASL